MNKLLLVAFHFPPYSGGSGVHRASKFSRYLPENGWFPYVLSVNPRAYENVDPVTIDKALDAGHVTRAFALDARRHLAINGRYLMLSALPDRWANWAVAGVFAGLIQVYSRKVDAILVTFPIATAVLIGLVLHRITKTPLVVDFRDSMTEEDYPRDRLARTVCQWIERAVIRHGARFIFTTSSSRQMYLNRYSNLLPSNCVVIPNGYDEEDFCGIEVISNPNRAQGRLRLVHAGLIYPDERDPRKFFRAIQQLKLQGRISSQNLTVDLRASGSEQYFSKLLHELCIEDVVRLLPSLPHLQALRNIAAADGLLLFQAASCNHQIPAKVYEYLRLEKPILALTSPSGDTATLLNEVGGATIADLADEDSIIRSLPTFITSVRDGTHPLPDPRKVTRHTRRNGTAELARCLDQVLRERSLKVGITSAPHEDDLA